MKKSEKETVNGLKEKVNNNSNKDTSLYIGRVPRKEREWFVQTANEEFEGDFGMLLKWLCQGYMPPSETQNGLMIEELARRLDTIEQRLLKLEVSINTEKQNEDKSAITTLSGKKIRKRGNENE